MNAAKKVISVLFILIASFCLAQTDSSLMKISEMRNELDVYLKSQPQASKKNPDLVFLHKAVYDSLINLMRTLNAALEECGKKSAQTALGMGAAYPSQGPTGSDTLYFDINSSELTELHKSRIDNFVIRNGANKRYTVLGFSDITGTKEVNLELSKNRAFAVRAYLIINKKINPKNITINFFGSEQLRCQSPDEACNKLNRRVEISTK